VREREREAWERVVGDLLVVVPEMVEKKAVKARIYLVARNLNKSIQTQQLIKSQLGSSFQSGF
jgi:hypothetical protein